MPTFKGGPVKVVLYATNCAFLGGVGVEPNCEVCGITANSQANLDAHLRGNIFVFASLVKGTVSQD